MKTIISVFIAAVIGASVLYVWVEGFRHERKLRRMREETDRKFQLRRYPNGNGDDHHEPKRARFLP